MNKNKQIEEMSKERQEYLKYKPFADDLRKAESWCELDGVLNRYQTVKNLSKMGYRKASEVAREIVEKIEKIFGVRLWLNSTPQQYQDYEELKKKYTEADNDGRI